MLWRRKQTCNTDDCQPKPAGIDDIVPSTRREQRLIDQIRAVRRRQDRAVAEIEHHLRLRAAGDMK